MSVIEGHDRRAEVGHTPSSPDGLVIALLTQGFADDELVDAGLARRSLTTGRLTDFYRRRTLIPIRDEQGTVSGLIGRNVGDARFPKYTNPPRTAVYEKSVNLYQPLPTPGHPDGRVSLAIDAGSGSASGPANNRYGPSKRGGRSTALRASTIKPPTAVPPGAARRAPRHCQRNRPGDGRRAASKSPRLRGQG